MANIRTNERVKSKEFFISYIISIKLQSKFFINCYHLGDLGILQEPMCFLYFVSFFRKTLDLIGMSFSLHIISTICPYELKLEHGLILPQGLKVLLQ